MQALSLSLAYVLPLLSAASPNPATLRADARSFSASSGLISSEVSAYAQGFIDNNLTPGLTLSVVRLDDDSVTTDFGARGNRTEDGDPAQPDTLFAIASVSKAFLTSALGILMDDFANGRNVTALPDGVPEFTFDTKLQALLPDVWKLEDDFASQKANFRDLLSHVTGLTRNEFMYTRTDTPLSLGKRFRYIHPGYELREQWSYSNLMYLFLPHVITTFSGKTFQEFVTERIFVPLNMTATTYNLTAADESGLMSQSFTFTGRRIPVIFQDPSAASFIAGAGGVISNAVDMAKWAATVLNQGVDPVSNTTIFPSWVYDETTTAREVMTGNTTADPTMSVAGYGLGWQRQSYLGHDIIMHDGGIPGFVSSLMILPNDNLAVVALLNTDGPWQDLVPLAVIDSVLGLNATPPPLTSSGSPSSEPDRELRTEHPDRELWGTYVNPGYGNITFCAPGDTSTAYYCASALSDWAAISCEQYRHRRRERAVRDHPADHQRTP
ncbi:beta-lactamase/transpeptidase-like protein [Cerioporus squamosus]|nr:beta-lactamase/transpeptidase-like protein [Cerioporus squamosus]